MANNKRLQVAKLLDRLGNEESEEEDEDGFEQFQPRFACPYCYEQFEITTLCVHLVDEHMFDSKAVLCPICANDVDGKELVNHITVQHESLFGFNKTKKPKKLFLASRETNNPMSQARKELQQTYLRALLQTGSTNNNNNNNSLNNEATTSLFSSLLSDLDNNNLGGQSAKKPNLPVVPLVEDLVRKPLPVVRSFKSRIDFPLSKEEKELRHKRSLVRASFTRDLILSTLFGE